MEYGLKFHLLHVHTSQKNIEIPPCAKDAIFITELAILANILLFYELENIFPKKVLRIHGFQNYFFYTTFHHHF